ncbi:MAG TPA: hypothetical protein VH560_05305 [Polyangia bacterium]|nr:hypothetical protein [Polyangia bacterium]
MTGRSAALQGGLALAGLIVANFTWQRAPERAPGEVTVIDASKADVSHVRYEDVENILGVERRTEGGEAVAWVRIEPKAKTPPATQSEPAAPKPDTKPEPPPTRELRGNADALRLLDRFAPFVSPRAFGVITGDKLKELGLDAPTRHLELIVRGDTRKYDVGIALNAQNGEAFLRDTRDGRVYLMPRGLLIDLGNSKRLIDSRLHTFDTKEFDRIAISGGGKHKEFLHVGRDNFSTEGYVPPKAPDKRDQMAKNWAEMVWRLFPSETLGKDELPKGGTLKTLLRVEYTEKGNPVGWIDIARLGSNTDESGSEQDNLYARSEHTVGWARLHATEQLISDGEKLLAAP